MTAARWFAGLGVALLASARTSSALADPPLPVATPAPKAAEPALSAWPTAEHPSPMALPPDQWAGFLTPGFLASDSATRLHVAGLGGELSYTLYPLHDPFGFGLFGQAQAYGVGSSGAGKAYSHVQGRYAAGAELNYWIVGLEIGWAMREGVDGFRTTQGLEVAPFLSIGVLAIGLRIVAPIARDGSGVLPQYGPEVSGTLAIKVPIPIGPHGRDIVDVFLPCPRVGRCRPL